MTLDEAKALCEAWLSLKVKNEHFDRLHLDELVRTLVRMPIEETYKLAEVYGVSIRPRGAQKKMKVCQMLKIRERLEKLKKERANGCRNDGDENTAPGADVHHL